MILFFNMCVRLLSSSFTNQSPPPPPQKPSTPKVCTNLLNTKKFFNVNFGAWFSLHPMLHWNVVMKVGHFSCGHFEYLKFFRAHSKCQLVYLLSRQNRWANFNDLCKLAKKFREFEMRIGHWTLNIPRALDIFSGSWK